MSQIEYDELIVILNGEDLVFDFRKKAKTIQTRTVVKGLVSLKERAYISITKIQGSMEDDKDHRAMCDAVDRAFGG